MRHPSITILPDDHAVHAQRWSVVGARRQATVYARWKHEACLLGGQLLGLPPGKVIAVDSPAFLASLELA